MKPLFLVAVVIAALAIADVNARANGIRSDDPPVEDTEAPEPEPEPEEPASTPRASTNPPPTEAPEDPSTSNPDPRPPQEGDSCDPEVCRTIGYCQSYLRCDNGTLVREECGEGLVWNPKDENGNDQIHGGNCATWESLSKEIERQYRTDEECLACFWRATGSCSAEYLYQAPNLRHRNVLRLRCSDGLVFSPEKETCQWKSDVPACNSTATPAP